MRSTIYIKIKTYPIKSIIDYTKQCDSPCLVLQYSAALSLNLDPVDPLIAKIEFIIIIETDCYLNVFNLIAIRLDFCGRIVYNHNVINRINASVDVYGNLNFDACEINDVIKILTLIAVLDSSTLRFDRNDLILDKLSAFESGYLKVNNSNPGVTMNNSYKIGGAAVVVAIFLDVIPFVTQVIDVSPLRIILLIEFHVIIITIIQRILDLAIQTIIEGVNCRRQVTHHVCDAFCHFLIFLCFFIVGEFINVVLLKKY